jgi:nucleolar protein 12
LNDFETTVFIGNLPFITNEEDLRRHFSDLETNGDSGISNVRVIRDPKTFIGKGIAYIQFKTKETMKKAIETKNDSRFNGRPIRVKKAVEARRLDKKK